MTIQDERNSPIKIFNKRVLKIYIHEAENNEAYICVISQE